MSVGELECPLLASSVYRGCTLEIFGVPFPIDLIPIPMGDVGVIVGMDWLSRFGAIIDCEVQRVVVRTPSRGELVIYGEGTRSGLGFYSAARARKYIQHMCASYIAYVVDMWVRYQISVLEVPVVREFADVFPEELPGVPSEN